ncbi:MULTISPECIES: TetR/AcrR family transcriptional regulator [unclassified Curtobacterium]|uniref:TetR/AcrR family transcriptional regulator n=1 Tax=unclassified Curtobacterium TaxID=257496 RepID=UPI000F46653A|nr:MULTISPECIES: TetR/AcrR family transcriptional regulator [unclassified Curtobacterium]NQW91254.1 TetR/AcrR family transcriptional regulator [Curtobacterium sp. VKM Ac-2861]ROQ17513.1 TetR family transcriptional regulator [Curtobacterium sp. PhB171]ROQ29242.1 TetR family transcriptional regulator [Curtobacterium sp. PhB170]ROS36454.1 TetR family transcriptional regulator [Curtobacterium sp. PhB78]ROS45614.1 TetR family transcriptional regulator [Curtobacterium sp. PhB131]
MTTGEEGARSKRVTATRELILTAAERLYAEYGIAHISNRQIGEAAGQGNTAVVSYHFGSKHELIRAILGRHQRRINELRLLELARIDGSTDVRDWIGCFVRATTTHLAALGSPTWYGRFSAQVATDPAWADIAMDEARETPSLLRIAEGIRSCLPDLPRQVRAERNAMGRILLTQMIAEHERSLERGGPRIWSDWSDVAAALTNAISALWFVDLPTADRLP